jgi:hypothetical protein
MFVAPARAFPGLLAFLSLLQQSPSLPIFPEWPCFRMCWHSQVERLQSEPVVFQSSRDSQTGAPLELPSGACTACGLQLAAGTGRGAHAKPPLPLHLQCKACKQLTWQLAAAGVAPATGPVLPPTCQHNLPALPCCPCSSLPVRAQLQSAHPGGRRRGLPAVRRRAP